MPRTESRVDSGSRTIMHLNKKGGDSSTWLIRDEWYTIRLEK